MKLSTGYILVGAGGLLTAIATGIATKLASDKVNEIRQVRAAQDPGFTDLTTWEKVKVYAKYEAIPLTMAIGTGVGGFQLHKETQKSIKLATNVSMGATTFINGYRDLAKETIGKKKEEALYEKAVGKNMEAQIKEKVPSNIVMGEHDCICCVVDDKGTPIFGDIFFTSTPTKIKKGNLDLQTKWVQRVHKSDLNDATISADEWFFYQGVETDDRMLRNLVWSWKQDGPFDVRFVPVMTENGYPLLGIMYTDEAGMIKLPHSL